MIVASVLCVLASGLFYINEPVVVMREKPEFDSKVVSQAIFSEEIDVKEMQDSWCLISSSDGYAGWVPSNAFSKLSEPYIPSIKVSRLAAHVYAVSSIEYGPIKTLPFEAKLQVLDESDSRWIKVKFPSGEEGFIQKGDVEPGPKMRDKKDLAAFSLKFLGLPYTWGGRSSFGYDCSGFVQMLYSQIGIDLPRDSCQQILDSRLKKIAIDQMEAGDLLFFGPEEQKIMHVAMYLGEGQFIHATARENQPWIRLSSLQDAEWRGDSQAYYSYRAAYQLVEFE